MEAEWTRFKRNVHLANAVGPTPEAGAAFRATLRAAVGDSVARCRAERKRARDAETPRDTSDAAIAHHAKFTDALPLASYDRILHLVPRLVNVRARRPRAHTRLRACIAQRACAGRDPRRGHPRPRHGPQAAARPARDRVAVLEFLLRAEALRRRAARVRFPKMPSVNLPYARFEPTRRMRRHPVSKTRLPFQQTDTGRLVGTGCSGKQRENAAQTLTPSQRRVPPIAGPMAARLSIMRAARQLAVEAGVFIHVRNFQVHRESASCQSRSVLICFPCVSRSLIKLALYLSTQGRSTP